MFSVQALTGEVYGGAYRASRVRESCDLWQDDKARGAGGSPRRTGHLDRSGRRGGGRHRRDLRARDHRERRGRAIEDDGRDAGEAGAEEGDGGAAGPLTGEEEVIPGFTVKLRELVAVPKLLVTVMGPPVGLGG